jgi:hypothetical protein
MAKVCWERSPVSRLHILLFAQGPVLRREPGRDTKAELSKNFLFNCRKPARVARVGLWGALSFSELILGLIAGDTGRGVRNKAGTSSGWSAIIHDLSEITAQRAYTRKIVNCTRVAAGRRGRLCLAIMNADAKAGEGLPLIVYNGGPSGWQIFGDEFAAFISRTSQNATLSDSGSIPPGSTESIPRYGGESPEGGIPSFLLISLDRRPEN